MDNYWTDSQKRRKKALDAMLVDITLPKKDENLSDYEKGLRTYTTLLFYSNQELVELRLAIEEESKREKDTYMVMKWIRLDQAVAAVIKMKELSGKYYALNRNTGRKRKN